MPKTSLEANELVNPDIGGIAIVKRGANRIPFRIMKSEDPNMGIDLGKLGRSLFKSDAKPGVYAAIVRKGADEGPILAALAAAGLSVEDRKEDGAIVSFVQKGISDEDVAVLKVNGDLGLAITGLGKVQKAFTGYDFEGTEFADVMATGAFFPSVGTAMDMLRMTVGNIMSKADTPAAAAADIGKATEAFATFVTALTSALPVQAFKADTAVRKADAEKEKTTEKVTEPGKTTEKTTEKPAEKPAETQGADDDVEKADLSVAPKIGGKPVEGWATMSDADKKKWLKEHKADIDPPGKLPEKTQKADDDDDKDVVAKLTSIFTTGMERLATSFDDKMKAAIKPLEEGVAAVKTDLADTKKKVEKADAAINGTVLGSSAPERTDREIRKSDAAKVPPLLDTASIGWNGRDAHGRVTRLQ